MRRKQTLVNNSYSYKKLNRMSIVSWELPLKFLLEMSEGWFDIGSSLMKKEKNR